MLNFFLKLILVLMTFGCLLKRDYQNWCLSTLMVQPLMVVERQKNRRIIRHRRLKTKALINVEQRSLNHKVFRRQTKLPVGIAPMGMVQMAGVGADEEFAKCAAKYEIPVGVSTAASMSLEKYAEYSRGYAWFQLYYMADKAELEKLLNRILMAGYKTLIFTVDVPEIGLGRTKYETA